MRMPIRYKLFIVLLAFSLVPMFISRTLMGRTVLRTARDLAGSTRQELLEIVTAELEHNAATMLEGLEEGGKSMTLGAAMLAREAENALSCADNASAPPPSLWAVHQGSPPPDAAARGDYVKQTMMGGTRPVKISLESAAFRTVRGTPTPEELREMTRLNTLLPVFRRIYKTLNDDAVWLNVGMESGVFMTYPGHDDFPRMYDHRTQEWYRRARESGRPQVWTTPWIDPVTRRAVATISCPIRDAAGRFIGAASIDMPNANVLDDSVLSSRWSADIRSFMVTRHLDAETLQEGLLVLAQHSYDEGGHRRMMSSNIKAEWFREDAPETVSRIIRAMSERRVGHISLTMDDAPSVLAWASNPDFSFLLLAPESAVNRLPDQMAGQMNDTFAQMRQVSVGVAGAILVIVGLIAWFGSRAITWPLLSLVQMAKRLADGDFSVHFEHHLRDEREALVDAFNEMGPKLKEHLALRRDMELAQQVQTLLLPRADPELPGYDIAGGIHFCDQTGGDYYDFIPVPAPDPGVPPGLNVVLGDVSGHGVPSALVMATTRGQLHALCGRAMPPELRIRALNEVLSRDLFGTGRFLTLFCLQLVPDSGAVRWVRAGHDPAVRYDPALDRFGELNGDGLALGVLEDYAYQGFNADLAPGEVVVMATDGVWEARNAAGEMFGKRRMLAIIKENAHNNALGIRDALMRAVDDFQETQLDDIAVVVVKRGGERA